MVAPPSFPYVIFVKAPDDLESLQAIPEALSLDATGDQAKRSHVGSAVDENTNHRISTQDQ